MTEGQPTGNLAEADSGEDFFKALEDDVNSAIQDETLKEDPSEVTPPQTSGPEQVTHTTEGSKNEIDWEKRYKDSTREAQKLHGELSDLKPFVPVLNAMKEDSGLVDHVRDYLENGGTPAKSVTERLGLAEDFVYDAQAAVDDPDSDSARVFQHSVDKIVNAKVNKVITEERQANKSAADRNERARQEVEFKKKHKMSDEDFSAMINDSKNHIMTLEDIHLLLNRDKIAANTANAAKTDMRKQMKNVRNIPTSASGANSAGENAKTFEDQVFDAINGTDDVDNLFG